MRALVKAERAQGLTMMSMEEPQCKNSNRCQNKDPQNSNLWNRYAYLQLG